MTICMAVCVEVQQPPPAHFTILIFFFKCYPSDSVSWFITCMNGSRLLARAKRVDPTIPLFFIIGSKDNFTSPRRLQVLLYCLLEVGLFCLLFWTLFLNSNPPSTTCALQCIVNDFTDPSEPRVSHKVE